MAHLGYGYDDNDYGKHYDHHEKSQAMKVSRETAARHREELVQAASRLFRERGFDRVGVAEIAGAAGLTHGAFYTYFPSKEALCREAIARMPRRVSEAITPEAWRAYVEAYLSPRHVRDRAGGCPYAALSGDAPREAEPIKAAFAQELETSLDTLARRLPGRNSRHRAIASTALMVGALMLARSTTDPKLRDEILDTAKRELLGR
jgi:TetR/AcrR family transcriptional repressor of nem operon